MEENKTTQEHIKDTDNQKKFQQEQSQFNQKKQWEEPSLQKVMKSEVLDI